MSLDPEYMGVLCSDLLDACVLTEKELDWARNVRIPYMGGGSLWVEKWRIDNLVMTALAIGAIKKIERVASSPQRGPQIISDYIDGPMGALKNHADGKIYDSKSKYYKAVKEAGCVVMGNDAPTVCKEPEYKICEKELKRDIAQAYEQLGG